MNIEIIKKRRQNDFLKIKSWVPVANRQFEAQTLAFSRVTLKEIKLESVYIIANKIWTINVFKTKRKFSVDPQCKLNIKVLPHK